MKRTLPLLLSLTVVSILTSGVLTSELKEDEVLTRLKVCIFGFHERFQLTFCVPI